MVRGAFHIWGWLFLRPCILSLHRASLPRTNRICPVHSLSEARKNIVHRYISLIIACKQILRVIGL